VLVAGSASECIQRLTAWRWRWGDRLYWTPVHAYGDYAHAADAWGLERVNNPGNAELVWLCDPSSPLGQAEPSGLVTALFRNPAPAEVSGPTVVLDRAYAPLRLQGEGVLNPQQLDAVWQLWSPNKALGLTGVRGAYAIAPDGAQSDVAVLDNLAPSWPLGAHGVSLLSSWVDPGVQTWLADSRVVLLDWVNQLRLTLMGHGWTCAPSFTPYLCARPPQPLDTTGLWAQGIQLRDATSFGLAGWWRLSAQPPEALMALDRALYTARYSALQQEVF
jgi:histidinol-phosphate aminotransferase